MVLYHPSGRVVKPHEDYLEREAAMHAGKEEHLFEEQIEVCKKHNPKAAEDKDIVAYIVVERQTYYTMYCSEHLVSLWEEIKNFKIEGVSKIPDRGIDRATLMRCSTTADDYFRYHPNETDLCLPLLYPRKHMEGTGYEIDQAPKRDDNLLYPGLQYYHRNEDQMAYIRADEISKYIIPWLKKMQKHFRQMNNAKGKSSDKPAAREPYRKNKDGSKYGHNPVEDNALLIDNLPTDLLEQIHLYNAMLQLGLPSFIQRPLIDALVLQIYTTNLSNCHLDAIEMTVARFYSQGIPVLDPILSHLVGTYSFRSAADRNTPGPELSQLPPQSPPENQSNEEAFDETRYPYDFRRSARRYLDYASHPAHRPKYPTDTFVLPPELPVLGHCIRHWSGVHRNGSTTAAHTGYPLNVGRVKKFYRREAGHGVRMVERNLDFVEYSTYRLKRRDEYLGAPGEAQEPLLTHGDGEP